jgi:Type ISP C-terminal specificity domain/N-6 DNA Methylase
MSRYVSPDQAIDTYVAEFGAEVASKIATGEGHDEAQLRAPFERLLKKAGQALGVSVLTVDETPLKTLGVRPDFMVNVLGARVGYAELKAWGRKVPGVWTSPSDHESRQWDKLQQLPNVLYCDGEHWAIFRYGKPHGSVARLVGDIRNPRTRLRPADSSFRKVVCDFLLWKPDRPRSVDELVRAVARLCGLLRDEVREALREEKAGEKEDRVFSSLAADWRRYLFPDLNDKDFADAYAQTVTFALLLARDYGVSFEKADVKGNIQVVELAEIARQLGKRNSLMGKSLDVLTEGAIERRGIATTTLRRVVGAVDWQPISGGNPDAYLYLYERFLEEYDPQLRKRSGSYYTPNDVVAFMVRFAEEILRGPMKIRLALADRGVSIIDPAMGTGTFLLNILSSVARTVACEEGDEAVPPQLRSLFRRLIGFELKACPYAVTELRIHRVLKEHGTEVPERQSRLLLADTLDDPEIEPDHIPATLAPLARSRQQANEVKRNERIQLVIGNPPYGKTTRGRGGWIEKGSPALGGPPPLDAFRKPGNGSRESVLANQYVHFLRWATWKAFDAHPDDPRGIVAFIIPSSFTTGPGFAGIREYLRHTADEGWIIDLSPEHFRSPSRMRVFPRVPHKVCIAVFARYGQPNTDDAARVHYLPVYGLQAEKFRRLKTLSVADPGWSDCGDGWDDLMNLAPGTVWDQYPRLGDLMPWSESGCKPNRNWVYAPHPDILWNRWKRLILADTGDKPALFKETRDLTTGTSISPIFPGSPHSPPVALERSQDVAVERVALRSFDRQYVICDSRVLDFPHVSLWQARGANQVYVTEQHMHPIVRGPALTFAACVPGNHHYNGRGGRVLPLYRDPDGAIPNLAPGLITALRHRLRINIGPEDVLAYVAAVTAHPAYTARFVSELETPGVRIPLTADQGLWASAVRIGRIIVWLHTYGECYQDPANGRHNGPPLLPEEIRPRATATIPYAPGKMPAEISYDPLTETLHVGEGAIAPVPQRVWDYEVSGMRIVRRWFDYRKLKPRVKRSSPLDDIRADEWPPEFTTELRHLLSILRLCTDLEPEQATLLDRICSGPLISTADLEEARVLPVPEPRRRPPRPKNPDALELI